MFLAVLLFMTANALQFHFGQYVAYLNHGVDVLGRIAALSMLGTLCIRLHIGRLIDQAGCKATWLAGAVAFALATGAMQVTKDVYLLTALRALAVMSMATVMTTVAVCAALIAPPLRRAESIGSIGLAGLAGIMVGPTLGDLIFSGSTASIGPYRLFFTTSALLSLASGMVIMLGVVPGRQAETRGALQPSAGTLATIVHYWPGMILLIGLVFGMVFTVQSTFLERLAEARAFRDIKVFFLIYSPTAITLRIIFRRLPQRIGRRPTVLLGMFLLAAGLFCLAGAESQLALVVPGMLMGAGHCFIWPSMVDLAAGRLPPDRRGIGTSLILGAGDFGMLIGFGALGELFSTWGFALALGSLGLAVLTAALLYALSRSKTVAARGE